MGAQPLSVTAAVGLMSEMEVLHLLSESPLQLNRQNKCWHSTLGIMVKFYVVTMLCLNTSGNSPDVSLKIFNTAR